MAILSGNCDSAPLLRDWHRSSVPPRLISATVTYTLANHLRDNQRWRQRNSPAPRVRADGDLIAAYVRPCEVSSTDDCQEFNHRSTSARCLRMCADPRCEDGSLTLPSAGPADSERLQLVEIILPVGLMGTTVKSLGSANTFPASIVLQILLITIISISLIEISLIVYQSF